MNLWKVVKRSDKKLWSAISGTGLRIEYEAGKPANGVTREQHRDAPASYYFPDYVPGVFVFTSPKKAWEFCNQWSGCEVWECTGDVVQKRAKDVAIAVNVVLKKQVKRQKSS